MGGEGRGRALRRSARTRPGRRDPGAARARAGPVRRRHGGWAATRRCCGRRRTSGSGRGPRRRGAGAGPARLAGSLAGCVWCRPTSTSWRRFWRPRRPRRDRGLRSRRLLRRCSSSRPGGAQLAFDGPLDMRMGLSETTAADLVNQVSEGELETIFRAARSGRRGGSPAPSRDRAAGLSITTGELQRLIAAPRPRAARERADRSRHARLPSVADGGQPELAVR